MQAIVTPSQVTGIVTIPASKSAMQRACAAALIKRGQTILVNPGYSADDKAALDIITQLGAKINSKNNEIIITSDGIHPISDEINCGESGLSVRMFTPIAALADRSISIVGTGSLLKRPLDFFNKILPLLDVECKTNNGYLPMSVKGPLKPVNITVDGSLSSQYLTGLIMSYSAAKAKNVKITVLNLNSRPYIDLTIKVMKEFGLKCPINKNYEEFYFEDQTNELDQPQPFHFRVEADWSGGAFLLVAAAIAGEATIQGLDIHSPQADKAIIEALNKAGVKTEVEDNKIYIHNGPLRSFQFDATDCPDLFPPLVSLAAFADGITIIKGVSRLTHKESNRALTLQQEFEKMGVKITLQNDLMHVEGGKSVKAARLDSHHDHRIAMACAVAALKAENNSIIDHAEAVNKSYPDFWSHLQSMTTAITLKQN